MLSDGIETSRGRSGAKLHRDQVNGRVKGRRGARLCRYHVRRRDSRERKCILVIAEPEGKNVGTLDEDFRGREPRPATSFSLEPIPWRIKRVESGRVRVEDAHGAAPSIPFWLGEAPGRSRELSAEGAEISERHYRKRPRRRRKSFRRPNVASG